MAGEREVQTMQNKHTKAFLQMYVHTKKTLKMEGVLPFLV